MINIVDMSDANIYIYPEVKELNFNAEFQEIHTACMTDAGIPLYASNDTPYQKSIIEKKDVGSYPVVFYVLGESDSPVINVGTANINKSNPFKAIPTLRNSIRFTGYSFDPILKNGSVKWGGSLTNRIYDYRKSAMVDTISEPGTYYLCTRILDSQGDEISYQNLMWPTDEVYESAFVQEDGSTYVRWNKFEVEPAITAWTSAPSAVKSNYTGSSIKLCKAGKVCLDNCTVYYKVGNGSFSSHIPTDTRPGKYEVCYSVYYNNTVDDVSGFLTSRYAPDAEGSFTSIIKLKKFFTDDFAVVADFTYDGTMHELTNGGPKRNKDIAYYSLTDDIGMSGKANEKLSVKDPGTYEVWYWCETEDEVVVTTDIAPDGMPDEHTPVKKGTVTVHKGTFFSKDFSLIDDFEYDGREHVLVKGKALRDGDVIYYSTDNITYDNVKPIAKNAGVYDVYVKPYDSCNDLVDYTKTCDGVPKEQDCIYLGRVTVGKVKTYLDNERFRLWWNTEISYDGKEHDFFIGLDKPASLNDLLSSEFGTFENNVYFSSDRKNWTNLADMNWGIGLGLLWATNCGTYTTYYKVIPDDLINYEESEIYSVTVKIVPE